jgi:uncharacterized protein YkwD
LSGLVLPAFAAAVWLQPSCITAAPRNTAARPAQTRVSQSRPTNAGGQLLRYQTALDLVAQKQFVEARVVLEDAVRRYGDSNEISLLLAYVLEREGRISQARGVLTRIAPRSPLAAAYLSRMGAGQSTLATPARTRPAAQSNAENTARSPIADQRLARLEKIMLDLVNGVRRQNGLRALQWSDDVAEVARAHSVEMRERDYFAHESPTPGLTAPLDRYVAGLSRTPHIVAENIYRYWGSRRAISDNDVRTGHTALMNSPGHRANILHRDVTRIGIGLAANANGDIWITQMFDKP